MAVSHSKPIQISKFGMDQHLFGTSDPNSAAAGCAGPAGATVSFPVTDRLGSVVAYTTLDSDVAAGFYARGTSVCLCVSTDGAPYANVSIDGCRMRLAHHVAGSPLHGHYKDHIDGDTLNNTRVNLRDLSPSDNSQNRRKQPGLTSQYLGVASETRGYRAMATIRGQTTRLGSFVTEEAAAAAYDRFQLNQRGPGAKLNGVLSEQEKSAALAAAPGDLLHPQHRRRSLPRNVYAASRGRGGFEGRWTDADGVERSRTFPDVASAQQHAAKQKEAVQLSRAEAKMTRNAEGEAVIHTNQRRGQRRDVLVDADLWHRINEWSWSWSTTKRGPGTPKGTYKGRTIGMARAVWMIAHGDDSIPPKMEIDHVAHNHADCRIGQLRLLGSGAQKQNRRKRKWNGRSSNYIGVTPEPDGRWRAKISKDHATTALGRFISEHEAGLAYNVAAVKLYDKPLLNVIPPSAVGDVRETPRKLGRRKRRAEAAEEVGTHHP